MKAAILKPILLIAALMAAASSNASVYSDDLSRCLVSATSTKDKTDLVRWVFANAALHPQVAAISSVSPEQRTGLNRTMGKLVQRLVTEDCRKQTQEAVKYEGQVAFQMSFQVLGQVAMKELMSEPAVSRSFGDFATYMDEGKLRAVGLGQGK